MKIERKVFHRRDAENTEMRYLFSLPLRGRQRKMLMPFGQGLAEVKMFSSAISAPSQAGGYKDRALFT
jgi:hypothetical protein